MTTKKSTELTLRDKLSRLTYTQACKLLGEDGPNLIRKGAAFVIDIDSQVRLNDRRFELRFPAPDNTVVTISLEDDAHQRLRWRCSTSNTACPAVGAAFSLILEEKRALGLAVTPDEDLPSELLSEEALVKRALAERAERARAEKMQLRSTDPSQPWTDYLITNPESGKTYRVNLRGEEQGQSYCSCPDFRTNTLGTCKHILHALHKVRQRFSAAIRRRPYRRERSLLYLHYGSDLALRLETPDRLAPEIEPLIRPLQTGTSPTSTTCCGACAGYRPPATKSPSRPTPRSTSSSGCSRIASGIAWPRFRRDPARHPLRKELLKTELLPYQLDGIAFAVGAGRAILADDMGLGKTIQGVGVAEVLAREAEIAKVLVVCPASLKSQWRNEIHRFSHRDCQLVIGTARQRAEQYSDPCFFTICNYEQVLRDILPIERVKWDLIILDEGQRIKNWEAKTSRVHQGPEIPLRPGAVRHAAGEPPGRTVLGRAVHRRPPPRPRLPLLPSAIAWWTSTARCWATRTSSELRENLKPDPAAADAGFGDAAVAAADHGDRPHPAHRRTGGPAPRPHETVVQITSKKFLTEMDLLRLQKALLMCRMSANSTFLVDKQPPGFSSKLQRLDELIEQLFAEPDRKAVLFSEWTTMLDLIEPLLTSRRIPFRAAGRLGARRSSGSSW